MKHTALKLILTIIVIASITGSIIFSLRNNTPERNVAEEDTIMTVDVPGSEPPYNFDYSWAEGHPYIAHAFGGILGDSYTNSYEAFLLNYQLGHRVFEADFSITDDGKTVIAHDPEHWAKIANVYPDSDAGAPTLDTTAFTYDNFMSSLWYDKYHPVDLTKLFKLMQDYPDIYIVTDTKYFDAERVEQQFSAFVSAASEIDPSLLDRFIIQIYQPEMLGMIMKVYPWKSVIYTLYVNWNTWTPENVLEFSNQSGIKLITLVGSWLTEDVAKLWQSSGITIAVHTINRLEYANELRSRGASVIYTDFLLP